jgi:hypothetical protein
MATPAQDDPNQGYVQIHATALNLPVKREAQKLVQNLIFKILVLQREDTLESVRFQFSDEEELGFLYEGTYDLARFNTMKEEQALEFDFGDLANVVRQLLGQLPQDVNLDGQDTPYKAVFKIGEEPPPIEEEDDEPLPPLNVFVISQLLNLRKVPLLTLDFDQCPPERSTAVSQARYNESVAKLKELKTEYTDIVKRLERQAPKILQSFKRANTTA